jgi:hypothetical protein
MKRTMTSSNGPPGALAMPDWQAGSALTAAKLELEQRYLLQRGRRHLRLVHGWGVVCGLNVVPVAGSGGWEFLVCPGYGVGPCGDELLLNRQLAFNLRDFLWTRPMDIYSEEAWVQLEAAEMASDYEPRGSQGCGCGCGCGCDDGMQTAGLADLPRITIAWVRPAVVFAGGTLCSGRPLPCPVCPESCALTLGSIALPRS